MKYKIYYHGIDDNVTDSLIVEGETIEEVRKKAFAEANKRGWHSDDWYSVRLDTGEGK